MTLFEKIASLVCQDFSANDIISTLHLTEEILQERGMSLSDIHHSLDAHYRINFNGKSVLEVGGRLNSLYVQTVLNKACALDFC